MESGIRRYEAENKTGNPVLDTLLTAKSMDCQQRGIEAKVGKALMGANGRTLIAGGQRGFIKVVADAQDGRVLGAQLMCERATDMIDSFTVAIANGLTAAQLMRAVRPHPTFLEAVGEALDALEGRAIHS